MLKHSNKILQLATSLSSRQAAFLFALVGVIVQAFHTYYITNELSSLSGFWRVLQALLMAGFISCALLYFTLKSSDEDTKSARRYRKTVWWFAIIETFINLYYWGNHLLIQPWPKPDYGSFIIAIPFSILIPFTLKVYAGEVRTDDYSDVEQDEEPHYDPEQFDPPYPYEHTTSDMEELMKLKEKLNVMPLPGAHTENQQISKNDGFKDLDEVFDTFGIDKEVPEDDQPEEFFVPDIQESEPELIKEIPIEQPTEEIPKTVEQPSEEASTEQLTEEQPIEETKPAPEIPSLGKSVLGAFATNGGISTAPAYVQPKTPQPTSEKDLFDYNK